MIPTSRRRSKRGFRFCATRLLPRCSLRGGKNSQPWRFQRKQLRSTCCPPIKGCWSGFEAMHQRKPWMRSFESQFEQFSPSESYLKREGNHRNERIVERVFRRLVNSRQSG